MSGKSREPVEQKRARDRARYHRTIELMTPAQLKRYRERQRRRFKVWYAENCDYVISRVLERRAAVLVAAKAVRRKKA